MKRRTEFFLDPIRPFRLDLTAGALRRLPINIVDRWDGSTYRRVLLLPAGPVEVVVQQIKPPDTAPLKVSIKGRSLHYQEKAAAVAILERMLGLRVDLTEFYLAGLPPSDLRRLGFSRQKGRAQIPLPRYEVWAIWSK